MENASKALLMAAGVLMAVAVLSLAVYLYASFGGSAEIIQNNIEQGQLEQFNSPYIAFTTKECNAYDILSAVNLANDYNTKNSLTNTSEYYISVYVEDKSKRLKIVNDELTIESLKSKIITNPSVSEYGSVKYISGEGNKYVLDKFNCTLTYNQSTGQVNKLTFNSVTT